MKTTVRGYKKGRGPKSDFGKKIYEAAKRRAWRVGKFVPPGTEEETKLYKIILRGIQDISGLDREVKTSHQKDEWVAKHASLCAIKLNHVRTYANSEMQKCCKTYYEKHKNLPTPEMMEAFVDRDLDLSVPANMEFAKWYWNDFLVAAVANRYDWCPEHKLYGLISKQCPQDRPGKLCITPITEAYACGAFTNYRPFWIKKFEYNVQEQYKDWTVKNVVKKFPRGYVEDTEVTFDADNKTIWLHDCCTSPRWTKANSGASSTGGWSDNGLDYIEDMQASNAKARKERQSEVEAFEQKISQGQKDCCLQFGCTAEA